MGWGNRPDCEECGGMWELYEITNKKKCKCDSRAENADLSNVRSNELLARFYFDDTRIDGYWAIRDRIKEDESIWIDCPKEYLDIIITALNNKISG